MVPRTTSVPASVPLPVFDRLSHVFVSSCCASSWFGSDVSSGASGLHLLFQDAWVYNRLKDVEGHC